MRFFAFLALAAAFALAACETTSTTTSTTTTKIPTVRGYPETAWAGRLEADVWTAASHQAIDGLAPTLLSTTPRDIEAFCPGYAYQDGAGRRAFYVDLLAMIARQESNLDPAARFVEPNIRDAQGRNVVSTGLLQISQESANGYGCQITDQRQLEDGATNLRCGVRIASALIQRDGLISGYERGWKGAARYWAVLRDPAKLADVQQFTNTKPYCRRVIAR